MSAPSGGWFDRLSVSPAIMAFLGAQAICGAGSVLLWETRASAAYQSVNLTALVVGMASTFLLISLPLRLRWPAMLAAAALLATALFGVEQDGIRRWASVARSPALQPAFLLLPLLAVSYARTPDDRWHQTAIVVVAAAMALQPDRSMAAALVTVAAMIAIFQRTRGTLAILAVCVAALAATLWRPDPLSAVPFVEGVIAMAWQGGWWGKTQLLVAAGGLLLPLADWRKVSVDDRRAILGFVLCWATLFIASMIAPYPTPLLGYGPSAIIGYFLSIIALRKPTRVNESP